MISYGATIEIKSVCDSLPKSTRDFIADLVNEAKQKPQLASLKEISRGSTTINSPLAEP